MVSEKFQGFFISQLLLGFGLDHISDVDAEGFDGYFKAIYLSIKKSYAVNGTIDLSELEFGIEKSVEIMDHYGYLSLKLDTCVDAINNNAKHKQKDYIADALKNGNIEIQDAIEHLSQLNETRSEMLIDVSDLDYKSQEDCSKETIETGFLEYDSHINDWKLGELTVIFGRNGEGKTTFVSQVISHCISKKIKTFLYSGEMSDNKIQDWLYRQIVGSEKDYYKMFPSKYGMKYELKPEIIQGLKKWHDGTLFLYNRNPTKKVRNEIDRLFSTMEIAVKNGVKLFFIDNLMAVLEENADSLYSDQANFVQRCKNFSVNKNVHIVLMAHPNKEKKEITNEKGNLEKTDISGSNNIANKSDNIISIERVWQDDRTIDAIITSHKDRETGQRKVLNMLFSKSTLRFYNDITKQEVDYEWKKYIDKTVKYYNGKEQTFENGEFK